MFSRDRWLLPSDRTSKAVRWLPPSGKLFHRDSKSFREDSLFPKRLPLFSAVLFVRLLSPGKPLKGDHFVSSIVKMCADKLIFKAVIER